MGGRFRARLPFRWNDSIANVYLPFGVVRAFRAAGWAGTAIHRHQTEPGHGTPAHGDNDPSSPRAKSVR